MPYISQECMKDFFSSFKQNHYLSDSNRETIKSAMKFYFGYKEK